MTTPLTVAQKLLHALLVVAGVNVVVFTVTHFIGDPVHLMLPLDATNAQYVALKHQLGLDHSFLRLFANYFEAAVRGDFGNSLWQSRPALGVTLHHVMPTVELASAAIFLSVLFGVPAGFYSALRADTAVDRVLGFMAVVSVSVATFWLALMLILVFAVELRWFPTSGYGLRNLVLPAVAAAALPFGRIVQLARAAMAEEMMQPYFRVAQAKGLSLRRIVIVHAARNAFIPVLAFIGFEYAFLMGAGMIVTETIFNWPGVGYLTYQALEHRDFPLIQTCVLVIAVIVVITNLVVDAVHGLLDPRISGTV